MPPEFAATVVTLVGFALVDSVNPSCLATITVILTRPDAVRAGLAFTAGVAGTYLLLGAAILSGGTFLLSEEFWKGVEDGPGFAVEALVGLLILSLALRSSAAASEKEVEEARKATSGTPWGCAALGVAANVADLPTALPYFAALQVILTAAAQETVEFALLAGYNLVYVSPLLGLVAVRALFGDRLMRRLEERLPDLDRRIHAASRGLLATLGAVLCLDAASFVAFGSGFLP